MFPILSIFDRRRKVFSKIEQKQRDKRRKACVVNNFPVPLASGTKVGQGRWKARGGPLNADCLLLVQLNVEHPELLTAHGSLLTLWDNGTGSSHLGFRVEYEQSSGETGASNPNKDA